MWVSWVAVKANPPGASGEVERGAFEERFTEEVFGVLSVPLGIGLEGVLVGAEVGMDLESI